MKNKKKIALVTGANKGIGKSIAYILSQNNITVIGTATSLNGKKNISKNLQSNGFGLILNTMYEYEISQCIRYINNNIGNIDILINNAGTKIDKLLINMKSYEWNNVLQINLNSIFHLCKLVIKPMIKNQYGRIITIGSIISYIGNIGQINYCASKAGIIGFNRTLALEVADKGITANIIAPGFIKTDMTKNIPKKKMQQYLSKIPLKKFGSTKDIAHAVLFLSSPSASYITGQTIHINGGMYMN
ncbi:3-oxoacyl-[acyl-carrier-protein] reductase FabG [Buchnera aphidicola (Pterocallis alni)]|uniref:3-oxoacyl-ACP reductase FabG n=1 Tax=Buchnera aphidicola TaxID=9 RepID=UPI0034642AE6